MYKKDLLRLFEFQPQLSEEEYGAEPCIRELIEGYYRKYMDSRDVEDLTNLYIEKLIEDFSVEKIIDEVL